MQHQVQKFRVREFNFEVEVDSRFVSVINDEELNDFVIAYTRTTVRGFPEELCVSNSTIILPYMHL